MKASDIHSRDLLSLIALLGLLAWVGCGLFPSSKPEGTASQQATASNDAPAGKKRSTAEETSKELRLNGGFTLLYELMAKESDVDRILILRNASIPTQALAREIAEVCTTAKQHLDSLSKQNPLLRMENNDLPRAEIDVREAIEWATTKKLLLGSEFELKLILTQISATEYAAFLAQTLAGRDQDKERKVWLKELATRFQDLHQKLVQRLMVKP